MACVATAMPGIRVLGPDPLVEQLQGLCQLRQEDLVVLRIKANDHPVTLIGVPTRAWHRPAVKRNLSLLKRAATREGHRVVLVPQSYIRRQPRLANSQLIAKCASLSVSATDRSAIVRFLTEMPVSDLDDAASVVGGPDPVGCVLKLVTEGLLEIDLEHPITPYSRVSVRSPGRS